MRIAAYAGCRPALLNPAAKIRLLEGSLRGDPLDRRPLVTILPRLPRADVRTGHAVVELAEGESLTPEAVAVINDAVNAQASAVVACSSLDAAFAAFKHLSAMQRPGGGV